MKRSSIGIWAWSFFGATLALMGWSMTVQAAAPATEEANRTWTLATDDTELTLSVSNHAISLVGLRNPDQKWNWIAAPSPVPTPGLQAGKAAGAVTWEFRDATEDKKRGHQLTLRFTCANPAMELKSVWRALPGPGPVENEVSVENKSAGNVIFAPTPSAGIPLAANAPVTVLRARKSNWGQGLVEGELIHPGSKSWSDDSWIPMLMFGVGKTHGAYIGSEWELGGLGWSAEKDPLQPFCSVNPITESITRAPGGMFQIPAVYYGVYRGDFDDGSNRFKRWFWNHKITRSLHDHEDEPWAQNCVEVNSKTPQSFYDSNAATGVECIKNEDGWWPCQDWTNTNSFPNGVDYGIKAHKAGLKASLYMIGTYNNVDLATIAGRDAELEALSSRYDKGWFDMWRTDKWISKTWPFPANYEGLANFLYIQDRMIASRPGYRWENCANGGTYKGFAVCRRMTFCTQNDTGDPPLVRSTFYANSYFINPVQLKSDTGDHLFTVLRTAMMGAWMTVRTSREIARDYLVLYKTKQRPILRGANVYHILPMPNNRDWEGMEFYNPDLDKGSVFLFKPSVLAFDGDEKVIKLKGLDRSKTYTLSFQDRTNLNCAATGVKLMDEGILVSGMTGDLASEIIWIDGPGKR